MNPLTLMSSRLQTQFSKLKTGEFPTKPTNAEADRNEINGYSLALASAPQLDAFDGALDGKFVDADGSVSSSFSFVLVGESGSGSVSCIIKRRSRAETSKTFGAYSTAFLANVSASRRILSASATKLFKNTRRWVSSLQSIPASPLRLETSQYLEKSCWDAHCSGDSPCNLARS
jgi:hypothetical protein